MANVWWNQVPNALKYTNDIKNSLLDGKSVLIISKQRFPWQDDWKELLEEAIRQETGEKKFVDAPPVNEPGKYLLEEGCKKETRALYRPLKGYADFLAENDDITLHDWYLRVEVDSDIQLKKWIEFVSEYVNKRKKKNRLAVFLLKWCGDYIPELMKGITVFNFDDYIEEFDKIVFSFLLSSDLKGNDFIKTYLAELAVNVAGNDVELCAECVREGDEFLASPENCISRIAQETCRSDGSAYDAEGLLADIKNHIWSAQIKTIYPQVERYRQYFVDKYSKQIKKGLPIATRYGEVDSPYEVELGTLVFMAGSRQIELSEKEYNKLKKNREARNKLSHLSVLSLDEIKELLQSGFYC